jgi:hypothetical protein
MRADMAKRGRMPLPEWRRLLQEAGYETQTQFFDEWVEIFLAARPQGRESLRKMSDEDAHKD